LSALFSLLAVTFNYHLLAVLSYDLFAKGLLYQERKRITVQKFLYFLIFNFHLTTCVSFNTLAPTIRHPLSNEIVWCFLRSVIVSPIKKDASQGYDQLASYTVLFSPHPYRCCLAQSVKALVLILFISQPTMIMEINTTSHHLP
jgi:hypothetical protein